MTIDGIIREPPEPQGPSEDELEQERQRVQ